MKKAILIVMLLALHSAIFAQVNTPAYQIIKDSATHTTVLHSNDGEYMRVRNAFGEKGLFVAIAPDVRIESGIVDHKGPTGDLYVREYYYGDKLTGYIQYDGSEREREIYYNSKGDIYLEKRYYKAALTYQNDSVRKPSVLSIPVKVANENSSR